MAKSAGQKLLQPDEIVRKILEGRGIVSDEEAREFLSKNPKLTYDPLLLPNMEAGADFILDKLSKDMRICVYGDYDADGICGAALLVLFLREAVRVLGSGSEIEYYIPSRIEEGYGLNKAALLGIKERGSEAVVTVDCGSVSVEEVLYAKEIGLDIMITDHHDLEADMLPDCIVINPKLKRDGAGYPFEKLSGTGVAFKLCAAITNQVASCSRFIGCSNRDSSSVCERDNANLQGTVGFSQQDPNHGAACSRSIGCSNRDEVNGELRGCLHSLVDLVCVATIADVMPLVDENRTFVKYGLSQLRKGTRRALRELLRVSDIDPEKIDSREVAFGIAPRINALGRMSDASDGVELFLTDDEDRIREIALRMNELNSKRKLIQDECIRKCMRLYEDDLDEEKKPRHMFLLLAPDGLYEGVAGIVAGKIREETGYPCAVLSKSQDDKGVLKGSARSGGKLDLIGLLKNHSDLFERYGGHSAAAGFSIREEVLEQLREALSEDIRIMLEKEPDLLIEKTEVELELDADVITVDLADMLSLLSPFGNGNPKPVIEISVSAEDIADIRYLGQERKHLRFSANGLGCIFFNGADTVFPGTGNVRIVGCPEINNWKGKRYLQFAIIRTDML